MVGAGWSRVVEDADSGGRLHLAHLRSRNVVVVEIAAGSMRTYWGGH